jgi:hypothetical protein
MKFSLFKEYGALNSKPVFEAFEHSLRAAGHTVCESDIEVGSLMGINKDRHGIKRGTWKVGLNGINRDAYFGPCNNNDDRHRLLGLSLKPWRTHGEYILICGQHDKSLQWQGMPSMSNWFMQTYREIRKHTDRPIIFRPHPRCRLPHIELGLKNVYRQEPKDRWSYDDYDMGFDDVHCTISYSSNPGIHSILNGVPAFVGTSSLAYDVGNDIDFLHDVEAPLMPNRQQWLNDYAHTEWTVQEITAGIPLKNLTSEF